MAMAFSQTELLFPTHAVPDAGPLPAGAERMEVSAEDGSRLHGIYIRPAEDSGERTLVLGFGGNGWNGQHVAEYLHELYPEAHVVAFHYRGYRPSTGRPSADALIADAPLVHDAAVERVRPERTVAVGFSIGSGVAATLSRKRKLDGLILVTPFDSLRAVAQSLYPWLPLGPFFQHEIDAAAALEGADVPVAIVAAGSDEIIPSARTDALRKRLGGAAYDRTIAGAGHNDIYSRADFQQAMHEALSAVVRR
jgi:pimeloyl-ACP methyl ester carboxylesterase